MKSALAAHRGARILLWEGTTVAIPALMARRHNFSVLAVPQNLESLSGRPADALALHQETALLTLADHRFCICEEEVWLLANLGLSADVLPYFPTEDRRNTFAAVAARRRRGGIAPDAPWLILGNAHHIPTRTGMRTILQSWSRSAGRWGRLVVAGFGTETLAAEAISDTIDFRGPIGDAALNEILATCRGLLVHQDHGAGALTRIPEALAAGLPVLANHIAARGTRGLVGLRIYHTESELGALLAATDFAPSPPLAAPAAEEGRFAETLRLLTAGSAASR